MADDTPKTRKVELTNRGAGPRTFFRADGQQEMLRVGESFEGEILAADYETLSPDLTGDAADANANAFSAFDFMPTKGLNKVQLLEVATREGYSTMAADASEDEIRKAIDEAREANPVYAEVKALRKEKRPALLKLAKDENVPVEGDDNHGQLVLKIAQARVAKANG